MARILSLFDFTGGMVRPWAEAGHECWIIDTQHTQLLFEDTLPGLPVWSSSLDLSNEHLLPVIAAWKPDIIFGFPPCTDLAVSGACRFAAKRAADPDFQVKATLLAKQTARLAATVTCTRREGGAVPYLVENPVSVLSTTWRKPDHIFNPCDFGGYLPDDDEHPLYPDVIPPRDAYTKRTCIWSGGGLRWPDTKPVDPVFLPSGLTPLQKLGGKSQRTKNIRSATPRGFAQAIYEANAPHLPQSSWHGNFWSVPRCVDQCAVRLGKVTRWAS